MNAGGLRALRHWLARDWITWRDWLMRRDLPGVGQDDGPGGFRACAADGVRALHRWYDPATGLWRRAGWWNAANALNAVIQYTQRTGDRSYAGVIETTFSAAQRKYRGFINDYYDDNGWWALTWVAAFDLTGDAEYLAAAESIFAQMTTGWDSKCGGGLWWTTSRTYKNAIPNELFLLLAARLHQRTQGESAAGYLQWALREWEWFAGSGMIGATGLVNDGLTPACANNGGTTWTYNQGVILGGLAVLHEITGEERYLDAGNAIAGAALRGLTAPSAAPRAPSAMPAPPAVPVTSAQTALDAVAPGMLVEPCERSPGGCNGDQSLFKGIFVRNLYDFYLRSRRDEYRAFILANAHAIWRNDRNRNNEFGLCWGGPFDSADASRQTSALDVLNAAVALTAELPPGRLEPYAWSWLGGEGMAAEPVSQHAAPAADRYAWAEPGAEDLGGGVYRIPLPLPGDALTAVNVYALTDSEGVDLIDAGMALASARERLATALRQTGYELGDVRNFFITHVHRDHYTLAVELRRSHGGAIALGEREQANLRAVHAAAAGRRERDIAGGLRRLGAAELEAGPAGRFVPYGPPNLADWEDPDHWLADGTDLDVRSRTLRVIHTPGHTRGHVVFHDAGTAALFAGDHVLPHITPSIGFEPAGNRLALRDYLGSLRLMLTLPDSRLLPAHGPVADSTHRRVTELLAHHETRLAETLEAIRAGMSTAYEAAKAIPWTRRKRKFADLEPFNQFLATNETAAHLEVLLLRGEVTRNTAPDGTELYSPAGPGSAGPAPAAPTEPT